MVFAHLLAFAGPTATGKTTIAKLLADNLRWNYLSFGAYVTEQALGRGLDSHSRAILQDLGQQLVEQDLTAFVRGVLSATSYAGEQSLILDGLRHQEVLEEICKQTNARWLRLIFLTAKLNVRRARLKPGDADAIARTDSHRVESQLGILRKKADLVIDTSDLKPSEAVEQIKKWLSKVGMKP